MSRTLDIYTRVSHKLESAEKVPSTKGQEQACLRRLERVGAKLGKVLTDPERSAWNPRVERPGWDELMARLESGESDGVVVFNIARFARRPKDGERLIEAAELGLSILDSGNEYDLSTASGKQNFRNQLSMAAFYSDDISDASRNGKLNKALRGEVDKRRSFGFKADGVTVNQDEAEVLRDCARRLLAGEPQETIIRDLNANGVPSVRGAKWGYTTFRQLMLRPRTAGLIAHNGQPVAKLPGTPILDADTYDRIRALYAARRPGRPPSGKYLLTGYAYCHDGSRLSGRPVSGTPRQHYWCKVCRGISVTVARLDEFVLDWAVRELSDPAHADAIARAEDELAEKRARIEGEIASRQATAKAMADRLGRGELDLDEYDAFRAPIRAQIAKLEAELAALDAEEPVVATGRQLPARDQAWLGWLEIATSGTVAERRAMIARALAGRRIIVGPGKAQRFDPDRVQIA